MTLFDRSQFSTVHRMEETLREMSQEAYMSYRRLAPKTETRHERVFLLGTYIARCEVPNWETIEVHPNPTWHEADGWRPDFEILSDGFPPLVVEISAKYKTHKDRERIDKIHDRGYQVDEYLNRELENEDEIMKIVRRLFRRRSF